MQHGRSLFTHMIIGLFLLLSASMALASQDTIKIALNYPETGPYRKEGKDQWKAAFLAKNEINAAGGILGKQIELITYDTKSSPAIAAANATRAIDTDGVKMVFGGSSSAVAVAVSKVCQKKGVPFFGTLTYSTSVTGKRGQAPYLQGML
jgi:branched-chain amino acid transport system substrate-binding protein